MAEGHSKSVSRMVRLRRLIQSQQLADHHLNLLFASTTCSSDSTLDHLRRVVEAADLLLGRSKHDHAPSLSDLHRTTYVLAEIEIFQRHCGRLVPVEQLNHGSVDQVESLGQRHLGGGLDHPSVESNGLALRPPHDAEAGICDPGIYPDYDHAAEFFRGQRMLRAREEKPDLLGCQLLENALGDVEVRMDLIDIVVILQRVH